LKEEKKNESLEKLVKDLKLSSDSSGMAASKSKKTTEAKDPTELRADELSEWEEADGRTLDKRKFSFVRSFVLSFFLMVTMVVGWSAE
jgi:hypothetical protein